MIKIIIIIIINILLLTCSNYCPPSIPIEYKKLPEYFINNKIYVDPELEDYVIKSFNAWKINVEIIIDVNNRNNKFHLIEKCEWWSGKTVRNDWYFNVYICKYAKNIQQTISHEISHVIGLKHGYGTNIIDKCYDVDFPEQDSLELIIY